ncbi:exopolysaccharide biosynthesis WecB/TagA/CpsF family protein [Panacagrimonas perspica]|uniref:Exopolysaccharide biosynthesis WecB/TagA/CpsF family protein n=1 Tax=Panacagrimonas perspica TaxID=381431 RepID=A0A4S3K9P5_9GAMM|nr:WecB/TagA/CpsF family glycosyltransferase [Panacagrimonas perspica]TDU28698.1 exopolysaccharide biosynthesis WecB/TagA/CpsF family protein [Panacagrimonas perspica]THD05022.1 glycosyltransferase [Panacagrimonas perspica]
MSTVSGSAGAAHSDGLAPLPAVDILGASVQNVSRAELFKRLERGVLFTPNVDLIMRMRKDREFHDVFHRAEFRVCDSKIVQLASRFLGTPLQEKISGSDFFPAFCEHHSGNPEMRVFLLGAGPGVAAEAMRRINRRLGSDVVIAALSPSFGFERNADECEAIVEAVNRSGASVLAVGLGAPKQEKWIMAHRDRMPGVRIFMGIGATIDFEAGNIQRAPQWMSAIGLEWLFRLLKEPRRLWRRYLVDDMPFLWLVLKQRLGLSTAADR